MTAKTTVEVAGVRRVVRDPDGGAYVRDNQWVVPPFEDMQPAVRLPGCSPRRPFTHKW